MNKLFKSVAILTIFSILTRLLSFVFKIVLSRSISTQMLGIYTISTSIFMVLVTIVSSGLPLTISRMTASYMARNKKDKLFRTLSCSLIITLILSSILIVIVLACKNLFSYLGDSLIYKMVALTLPAVLFSGIYATFRGYLWGLEKYFSVSVVELLEQIVRILSCVALLYLTHSFTKVLIPSLSLSIACIVSTLFGIILFIKSGGRLKKPNHEYTSILKSCAPITAVRTANSFLPPIMNILLPSRLMACGYTQAQSLAQLGIFMGMTMPLLSIPSTIIGSLAMALIPQITILHESKNNLTLGKQISSALQFTIFCSMICIPIFLSMGTTLCDWFFDNMQAGIYLTYASFLLIPMGIGMLTTSMLNSIGEEIKVFTYFIFSTIVTLLLLFILPQFVGVEAIIYAMGGGQILTCVLNIRKLRKTLHISIPILQPIVYQSIVAIIVTILGKFVHNVCLLLFPNIITILLVGLTCGISYILLASAFGQLDVEYIKRNISKKTRQQSKTV